MNFYFINISGEELKDIDKKIERDIKNIKADFGSNTGVIEDSVNELMGDLREKNGLPREWKPEIDLSGLNGKD